jgi:uncharacterized membrane protein YhhN
MRHGFNGRQAFPSLCLERAQIMTPYLALPIFPLALLVVLLIRAEFADIRKQIYVLKPACTLLVIAIALVMARSPAGADPAYSRGILGALALSLIGDIALMFKARRAFMLGLVAFLAAQVVYGITFTMFSSFKGIDILGAAVLAVPAVAFYWYVFSSLDSMKMPVLLYVLVISFMLNRAAATFFAGAFTPIHATVIFTGAFLFYIADLILAVCRFKIQWRYQRISLAFYYAGQVLLAMSVGMFEAGA